ncbi:hypothetical protein FACS189411_06300 [Bacteroidia bacterium]|nr:hypothetical protein FACS189411_06300 [Bacteroidia bacterium]
MFINKYFFLLLTCLFVPVCANAQFLNYGVDPARYKWKKASLEHYSLIYPAGLDSMAYRYAMYMETIHPHVQKTIGAPMKAKFPVILHPSNMVSNGMVAWSPRRVELLTTPNSRQQAEPWEQHLTVHESRHVLQTGKIMNGIFRPLYYLMGEQAAGLASAFLPTWFFEGDAVSTETAMTEAGRGRMPEFQMIYRTQMLSSNFYSFDKWNMGSYKDNTGTIYTLGYYLTSFGKYKYGTDIWDKATTRYVNHLISFPTFSNAFKLHTGANFDHLFNETFAFQKKEWAALDSGYITPAYLSPETKQFTSYQYPQLLNESTVISVKTKYNDIPALVAVTNGVEERMTYLGTLNSRIALHGSRVYWLEIIPGIRWSHENSSILKYFDLTNGKVETVGSRLRRTIAFSVNNDLSVPTEGLIATSQFTEAGKNLVVLLDPESGLDIDQHDTPGNAFIKDLSWGEGDILYTVAVKDDGITLYRLDTQTGEWTALLGPTHANISSPVYQKGQLYFESGLDGVNNIYAMDVKSLKTYLVTASRFGAFQPALSEDGQSLLYADYQTKGYRIASLPIGSTLKEADFSRPYRYTLAESLAEQEGYKLNADELKPVDFKPRPYHKLSHLFNVHSWAPLYYNVNDMMSGSSPDFQTAVRPGATLISQNALNTAVTQVGWYYDYERGYHHGALGFSYTGLFPVLNLNVDYGGKAYDMLWVQTPENNRYMAPFPTTRNLLEVEAQAYVPINLTKNHYVRGIQPAISYYFTSDRYQQYNTNRAPFYQYLLGEVRFYNYRKMAQQEILPRHGYQLRLQYLTMPFETDNRGDLYAARLTTYWPGLARTHALMLRLGYQYQTVDNKYLYVMKQLLDKPRGHDYLYRTRQQATLSADYAFPIIMPDLSLGRWAYIRRFRANLFYDLTYNQANKKSGWATQSSAGADILFDWNALRFTYPLVTGVRLVQPVNQGNFQAQLLFSISF